MYALVPFVADPAVQQYLATLLKIGLGTLAKYALKTVLLDEQQSNLGEAPVRAQEGQGILVGAIYAETVQITNHINNIGGAGSIELVPSKRLDIQPVRLTSETQKYIRELANKSYHGEFEGIVGHVTHLYPNRSLAEIKVAPGRYVKVHLSEEAFRFVRYETGEEEPLHFYGRPIITLGKDVTTYQEFKAESVDRVEVA